MFTREAVEDYLDRLRPDGVLLITRTPRQIARLFATVREVFERRGLGEPANHLFVIRSPLMPWGPRQDHTVFLLRKSPWTASELQALMERLSPDRPPSAADRGAAPEVLYSPFHPNLGNLYYELFHQLLTASNLRDIYAAQPFDVSPSTDDRPFFNQQARWSQLSLRSLNDTGSSSGTESMLVLLLAQTTIIAAILILVPLVRFSRQGLRVSGRWSFLTYFAGLGLGFIMIEIALLQRFTLFLGQPIHAFAVVLGSLLLFTGAGAYAGERLGRRPDRGLLGILPAALATLAVTAVAMPWVFQVALGFSLPWRVVVAAALVAPIGLLLGMPFPAGLRMVGAKAPSLVPWAWGVNGFFTVIGSVMAMTLGMILGFTTVLIVAGACYVACFLAVWMGHWHRPPWALQAANTSARRLKLR